MAAFHPFYDAHSIFGTFRSTVANEPFAIPTVDRRQHVYVLGKTGTGKSTLLEKLITQDIYAGRGVCLIDPHGDLAQRVADCIPRSRINDTIYFAPSDKEHPIGFNPLGYVHPDERELVASGMVAAFKGLWIHSWGEWLEYLLKNTILAMLEYPEPGLTLAALPRMLLDPAFRLHVLKFCKNREVRRFWEHFFNELGQRAELERVSSTLNKAGKLTLSPTVHNILGQVHSGFDFKRVLDTKQVLIINLSKGLIGADNANLLGSLIVSHIVRLTNQRAALPEHERIDHSLYIDEFQNFTTQEFENILSESRKYRLSITASNQYLEQIQKPVLDAILGNVGTFCLFAISPHDADVLEPEFRPVSAGDLIETDRGSFWARFRDNGEYRRPEHIRGLPPCDTLYRNSLNRVIRNSRTNYGTPRTLVEERLNRWNEADLKNGFKHY